MLQRSFLPLLLPSNAYFCTVMHLFRSNSSFAFHALLIHPSTLHPSINRAMLIHVLFYYYLTLLLLLTLVSL